MSDPVKHPIISAPATVIPPVVEPQGDRKSASMSPTTTSEQDRKSVASDDAAERKAEGQRQINLIWENTQMRVALSVIWSALAVAGILAVGSKFLGSPDIQLAAVVFLFGVANLVTGFYFGRTNHTRSGGIGGDNAGARS